ncbi:hypothetical protein C0J52_13451 [Blattella germanica]|nr:hypothetical protein C0J52_13451 [Blattella germanica]
MALLLMLKHVICGSRCYSFDHRQIEAVSVKDFHFKPAKSMHSRHRQTMDIKIYKCLGFFTSFKNCLPPESV